MIDERWRCFVAVPIGEALRADLRIAVDAWRGLGTDLRWTDPDGWHVTLAFLGPIEAASVFRLIERLALVAAEHSAMRFRTGGLGAFPAPARARVVWYGIDDEHGWLAHLACDVAAALDLDGTHTFRPHLTLARARRRPVDLRRWLSSVSVPEGGLEVDRVALMRSHVSGGPASYETLATVSLYCWPYRRQVLWPEAGRKVRSHSYSG